MTRQKDDFTLSKERFEAFSDGVFAIAITLLILEIHLPAERGQHMTRSQQIHALVVIWPQYLVYAASFATIGIMWLNHHAVFRYIERITHGVTLANLLLLSLISFLPFATEVLARFGLSPVAVAYYGLTMLAISVAYTILYMQACVAHYGRATALSAWSFVGLAFYSAASIIGYFAPIGGIALIVFLAIFYMLPSNVRAVAIRFHPNAGQPPS